MKQVVIRDFMFSLLKVRESDVNFLNRAVYEVLSESLSIVVL
ncbi:hypothetical protein NIES2104_12040 [Leptolyngbya sp. NIES-2104]|nr:hypothetical protein NIES2104_12040 [Leptolyngbya sp. NIES-2104]